MPRKQKLGTPFVPPPPVHVPPRLPSKDAEWGGFINIPFLDADKDMFLVWYLENETHVITYMTDLCQLGFKFSAGYDGANECFIATLTGKPSPDLDLRCSLSARNNSLMSATGLVIFKHYSVADQDWSLYTPKGERRKFDFG